MPPRRLTRRDGRALLVAEAPSNSLRASRRALDGPSGDRLASYCGVERALLLDQFDTVNLLGRPREREGKGSGWDRQAARRAARRLPLRGVVVLLGWRVADAYRMTTAPWVRGLAWGHWLQTPRGAWVTLLPHPSGVNHLYNDPAMRELAALALAEAASLAGRPCDALDAAASISPVPEGRRVG